jgi:hypothetical protein
LARKALLQRARVAQMSEHPLNASTTGAISLGEPVFGIGRRSRGDAAEKLGAHLRERTQSARDAEPRERDRRGADQPAWEPSSARGSRAPGGCACSASRHLDDEAVRRVERGDAHRCAAVVAVEERVLARRDCRRRRQIRAPSMISLRSERTW